MNTQPLSAALDPVEKLAQARQRIAWQAALWSAVALSLLVLAALAALDARWPRSTMSRAGMTLAGAAMLLCALSWRRYCAWREHTALEAARAWEQAHPEAGQRIRTALEVRKQTAGGITHRFTDRLLQEVAEELGRHRWQELAPGTKWRRRFALAALAFAGIVALAIAFPDFRLGIARMLPPWRAGTYTRISWSSIPSGFDERHQPHIGVVVGRRPAVPVLHVRLSGSGGAWKNITLAPLQDGRTWDTVLTGYSADFDVYAEAGDARTPVTTLSYRPFPKVTSAQVTLKFPDYTGLPAETRSGGDLRAVEGTDVVWKFTFNVPPGRLAWQFGGQSPESVVVDKGSKTATVHWPVVPGKFTATLSVSDDSGETLDAWRYSVEGVKDELPQVEILDLAKDAEATPVAELPIRVRATDDFGIGEIGLVLEVNGQRQWILEKTIDEHDRRSVNEFAIVELDKFPLTIHDNVRVYAYALDHKPRGGPRAVSALRAIDIREFKKLWRFRRVTGGAGGLTAGEAMALQAGLQNVEKLITAQRGVVSDVFAMREANRGEPPERVTAKVQDTQKAEEKVSADSSKLAQAWIEENAVPRDDVTLLSTASDQAHEAALSLSAPALEMAFTTSDRALTTLLQLRRHLLTVILQGGGSGGGGDEDEAKPGDLPKDLASLAKEAQRLAREENQVNKHLSAEPGADNNIEATRRQQEIAVSDAGELYTALVDHPDRQEGAIQLMDEAEGAMRDGDDQMHKADPLPAKPALSLAEQRLNELADFLRAMDIQNAANTLRELAAKTDGKSDSGEKNKGKGKGEDDKSGEKSGNPPGTAGKGNGGDGGSGGQDGNADAQKTERNAEMTDETLAAMAERAGKTANEQSGSGDDNENPADDLAAKLAKLREESGLRDLASDSRKLAQIEAGKGGDTAEAKELRDKVTGERSGVARALRDEAARMEASRAAQIAASQEEAQKLLQQLAGGDQAGKGDNGKGENGKKGDGGKGDGKGGNGKGTGKGDKGKGAGGQGGAGQGDQRGLVTGEGGQSSDNTPSKNSPVTGPRGGNGVTHFAKKLDDLNDKELQYYTSKLRDEPFDRDAIPLVQQVEKRLDEMLAELPGSTPVLTAGGRIPEARRREIEDYYRDLSDDLGDEQLQTEPHSK